MNQVTDDRLVAVAVLQNRQLFEKDKNDESYNIRFIKLILDMIKNASRIEYI